jgi:hypothetical protein
MNISREQWLARCAVAACTSSRWVSVASQVLAILALVALFFLQVQSQPTVGLAIAIAAASGAAQTYLASRVEFERVIFEEFASATDVGAAVSGFDAAAQEAGVVSAGKAGRELVQRIASLLMLTNVIFFLFLFQLVLLMGAGWVSR